MTIRKTQKHMLSWTHKSVAGPFAVVCSGILQYCRIIAWSLTMFSTCLERVCWWHQSQRLLIILLGW